MTALDASRGAVSPRSNGRLAPFIAAVAALLMGASATAQILPGAQRVELEVAGEKGPRTFVAFGFAPADPKTRRVPAVVLLHGSDGVTNAREGAWAREIASMGAVAFVVDSFGPRNVRSTIDDQTRVATGAMIEDAFLALEYLSSQDFVDPDRIAVMGFSKGGGAALLASDRRSLRAGQPFSAHVALYPFCSTQYRAPQPGGPLLVAIGDADDYTGVKTCADYVERIRKAGGRAELKLYKGAAHGFDTAQGAGQIASAQNFRDCVMMIEDDGSTVLAKTGQALPDPQKAIEALKRECMRTGATIAANPAARRQVAEDVKAFLRTHLFK